MDDDRGPVDLARGWSARPGRKQFVLVDCITLWISNLLARGRPVGEAVDGLCR